MKPNERPTYSAEQLEIFFDRISLPSASRKTSIEGLNTNDRFEFLAELQRRTLLSIPFENLTLHYSLERTPSLDPFDLLSKVTQNGSQRGGYCFENNTLFGTVLRSLGFNVTNLGARVATGADSWTGCFGTHMVNLITIDGTKYCVDVGFGARAATQPMLLESGKVVPQIGPPSTRLVHRSASQHTDSNQRLWIVEFRDDDEAEWSMKYGFTEVEFFPADYETGNFSVSKDPTIWFVQTAAAAKYLADEKGVMCGRVTMFGTKAKVVRDGQLVLERELQTEDERVEFLREHFGIELSASAREAIKGTPGEIRS